MGSAVLSLLRGLFVACPERGDSADALLSAIHGRADPEASGYLPAARVSEEVHALVDRLSLD